MFYGFLKKIKTFSEKFGLKKSLVAGAVLIILVYFLVGSFKKSFVELPVNLPVVVNIASVRSLSEEREALSVLGKVMSQTEANIQTESRGQITRVLYTLGDNVYAGAVIAELRNVSERANVRQAQAVLDNLVKSSSREESDARTGAINAYRNIFTLASDAIFNRADQFFDNPQTSAPRINISFFGVGDINKRRSKVGEILTGWQRGLKNISLESDLYKQIDQVKQDLFIIQTFLVDLSGSVNRQKISSSLSQNSLDLQKSSISIARSNIDAGIISLTKSEDRLNSTRLLYGKEYVSEKSEKIAVAKAALSSAQASLEKTIVRAPISGTINMLKLELGDFVSAFTPIVTIANNDALQIESFITEDDKADLAVGSNALIDGRYKGIIIRIAPALDPRTKKIQIKIGIKDKNTNLINGESVEVLLERRAGVSNRKEVEIAIPLSSLKVMSNSTIVFTVDKDSRLVAHPVLGGLILGGKVIIKEGITQDMFIVLDARGLRSGQEVEVVSN